MRPQSANIHAQHCIWNLKPQAPKPTLQSHFLSKAWSISLIGTSQGQNATCAKKYSPDQSKGTRFPPPFLVIKDQISALCA